MSNTTVSKSKQGYGYKYTDLAEIHNYLERINMKYYQYIEPLDGNDYIYTVPIQILSDGEEKELKPRRGCRIVTATLSGKSNPAQENGSAITYARRYSLLMAFGLATEDEDAAQVKNKPQTKTDEQLNQEMIKNVDPDLVPHGEGMTDSRLAKFRAELKRTGYKEKTILGYNKIEKAEDLTEEQFIALMNLLSKKASV